MFRAQEIKTQPSRAFVPKTGSRYLKRIIYNVDMEQIKKLFTWHQQHRSLASFFVITLCWTSHSTVIEVAAKAIANATAEVEPPSRVPSGTLERNSVISLSMRP